MFPLCYVVGVTPGRAATKVWAPQLGAAVASPGSPGRWSRPGGATAASSSQGPLGNLTRGSRKKCLCDILKIENCVCFVCKRCCAPLIMLCKAWESTKPAENDTDDKIFIVYICVFNVYMYI